MTGMIEAGISLVLELRMGNEDCWEQYQVFDTELHALSAEWHETQEVENEVAAFLVELIPVLSSSAANYTPLGHDGEEGIARKTLDLLARALEHSFNSFEDLRAEGSRQLGHDFLGTQARSKGVESAIEPHEIKQRLNEIQSLMIPLVETWNSREAIPVHEVVVVISVYPTYSGAIQQCEPEMRNELQEILEGFQDSLETALL